MGRKCQALNIEKWLKEGRGQGRGADYKPWLSVQSFSSRGYANRVRGWKTGREHHLMSNLELNFFHVLEWSTRVVDIREEYPLLPVAETLAIAKALDIRHPTDARTKMPIVLTSDFLLTLRGEPRDVDAARTVKPANDLLSTRTLEKLEIERYRWRMRKVDWAIVTDMDVPQIVARNLQWIHPYYQMPETPKLPENCPDKVDLIIREHLNRGSGLAASAQACDDKLGLEPGTSLTLARHFIASRRWLVNLNEKIDPSLPLQILNGVGDIRYGIVR